MGVLGGVFVLKSGLRILIRAPQVPFLVPPKTHFWLFWGYQKWHFRCTRYLEIGKNTELCWGPYPLWTRGTLVWLVVEHVSVLYHYQSSTESKSPPRTKEATLEPVNGGCCLQPTTRVATINIIFRQHYWRCLCVIVFLKCNDKDGGSLKVSEIRDSYCI